jgi:sigma-B regulation protein RsbU (phosphoserine phosphatase)
MATLHIRPLHGEPWTVELGQDVISIGRGPANDVSLADPNCSSRHAVIERAEDGFVLRDLGSKNGTQLNGGRITCAVALARGDEIKIGSTIVFFERPKGPRVTVVDAPTTSADASAAVPYREILDRTSGPGESTSRFAVPADMAEENRILQVLVGVGEALVAHKPVPELLEDILDVIAGYLPMDQCAIMLRAGGDGGLETRAARSQGRGKEAREIQVSRTIVNMAYEQHLAVLLKDAQEDPRVVNADSIISKGIRSALCVPIGDDADVIGVLYADRHSRQAPFRDADLRLLTLMASTAAVKIQQARQVEALLEAEKLRGELRIAANIQRDFLPRTLPAFEGYGMAGRALPCLGVGGDYFDVVALDGRRLGLAVGDVSGKGLGAALLMASLRAWLLAELDHAPDLAALGSRLNEFTCGSCDRHSFITFFFAELDRETGKLRYINAGHNPAFVVDAAGNLRDFPATGFALGMFAGRGYEIGTAALGPNEVLVLYTDGITESRNAAEEEFGVEGLADAVREERRKDAPAIVDAVFRRLGEFTDCAEAADDRTLVVVKRRAI